MTPTPPSKTRCAWPSPVPLAEPWLQHLVGLAKSDGAVIFNDRLEACQFRARLKPANICLLPDQDDLGGGMRHQVTREFSAYAPDVLGVCVSQDSYISLYRQRQAGEPVVLGRVVDGGRARDFRTCPALRPSSHPQSRGDPLGRPCIS